jgi:hypothetical protein
MRSLKSKLLVTSIFLLATFNLAWADQTQPLSLGPLEILPSGKSRLMIGGGSFNVLAGGGQTEDRTAAMLNLEYRFGKKISFLGFAVGGLVTSDSGGFVYVGNYADIRYKRIGATPMLSVGAYRKGAGLDLGGTLEFRSSITLAYELEDGSRFGVRVAHMSNASIYDDNPGENEILLTYDFSF